jgi:DNA-binding NarL/FixJ family response regulator
MQSFTVLVVDDHEAWRKSVRAVLKEDPELQVVGEASDGLEAVRKAQVLKPDLILLDLGLPSLNGIEASSRMAQLVPTSKILFLSSNSDADLVRAAMSDGARGYVLKIDAGRELLPGIKAIFRGEKFVSSGIETAVFPSENSTQASKRKPQR